MAKNARTTTERLILAATIIASGMAFLDGTVVNIAVPTIQKEFGAPLQSMLWVVNAFPLVLASLLLVSGSLSDRFGRKKIFSLGIIIFALGSILCGLAGSITGLEWFRALQGLGAAMMIPGSLAILNMSIPENRRGRAIGLWSGFSGGIAAAGPFVGGLLVQHFSWHAIFFLNIPLALLALLATVIAVPESKDPKAKKLDFLGTILISTGLFGLCYGLTNGPGLGWNNQSITVSLWGGVGVLILFFIVERFSKNPLIPLEIFKSKLVLGANLATLFLYAALSVVIFFLVLNFQQIQGYNPTLAGLGLLPTILLITFLSGPGGTLADRVGPRTPMIIGCLLVTCGLLFFLISGPHSHYALTFLPGLILFGLGMSLVIAPLTKSAMEVAPHFSGTASGVNNAVSRVAGLLAVAVLGALAISIFSAAMTSGLNKTNLTSTQKQIMLSQTSKFGGITIPETFNKTDMTTAQNAVQDAFMQSFRIVIISSAGLAFLSALVSFWLIRPVKQKRVTA